MAKRNVASGNDHVDMQIGVVKGSKGKTPKSAAPKKDAKTKTENVQTGSAKVGAQVDEIRGGLTIRHR